MTPAEFAAARQRLQLSTLELAMELGKEPAQIEAWESGRKRIPRDVASGLSLRTALAARDAALAASGLPECATAAEMMKAGAALDFDSDEGADASTTFLRHTRECPVCRARTEFLEKHAPPLPKEFEGGWIGRAAGVMERLATLLPPWKRDARPSDFKGRETGLFGALVLTGVAAIPITVFTLKELVDAGFGSDWWRGPFMILPAVMAGYFLGFGTAGAIYDALRPIRHTFIGYVLKCGLCVAAIYGAVGLVIPVFDPKEHYEWSSVGVIALGLGSVGAVAGAMLWVADRLRGKLPRPAR